MHFCLPALHKLCSLNIYPHIFIYNKYVLDEFNRYFASKKEQSRVTTSQAQGLKLVLEKCVDLAGTDDSSKYSYTRSSAGEYYFPVVDANILKIVSNGNIVDCLNEGEIYFKV